MGVRERWQGTKEIRFTTDEAVALILPLLQGDDRVLVGISLAPVLMMKMV